MARFTTGQHGIALIVSLILLLILTLISIASMRQSVLEERMAGSSHDHNRDLQAAEAALRDAERSLAREASKPFANRHGRYALNAPNRPAWAGGTAEEDESGGVIIPGRGRWNRRSSVAAPRRTDTPPRYIIERYPPLQHFGGRLEAGSPLSPSRIYRITASGPGNRVILQSTYRY